MPGTRGIWRWLAIGLALAWLGGLGLQAQVTETPQTIDPGRFLLRVDAVSLGVKPDSSDPNQVKALGLAWPLLAGGITRSLDFEVGGQFFVRDTYQIKGTNETHSGLGDVTFRTKWTFWRDPALNEAVAVIPYIKVPTNSNGVGNGFTEGGLIFPWERQFSSGMKAGAMVEWDHLRNFANTRFISRWYGSGLLKWEFGSMLGGYAETTVGTSSDSTSASYGTMGAGATLAVSKYFQWDVEVSRILGRSQAGWMEVLRFRWKL